MSNVTGILDQIRELPQEELLQVEQAVRALLESAPAVSEREAALEILRETGLVQHIQRPATWRRRERPLVHVQGKPLSETIIEERR